MISVLLPAKSEATRILQSVDRLDSFLVRYFQSGYEIIVSVNGDGTKEVQETARKLREVLADRPQVVIHEHFSPKGKGACLRSAFYQAKGDIIAFVDSDLPYDLRFFVEGFRLLSQGSELVLGNRRLPESHFVIPVPLLSLAYGRHRLGLAFNGLVRMLFPTLRTRDTQAGIKMMTKRVADHAFAHQQCPGFFFDVELILASQGLGVTVSELPVTLHLNYEKSTIRLLREGMRALKWLYRIKRNELRGEYKGIGHADHRRQVRVETWDHVRMTADDWGLSPAVNSGILDLVRMGVIRRVSMMADGEHLQYRLKELLACVPNVELGLHFSLTYGRPTVNEESGQDLLTDPSGHFLGPGKIMARAWKLRHSQGFQQQVCGEFRRQWKRLEQVGVQPVYFDGHHHVHLFPGLLRILRPVVEDLGVRQTRLVLDPALLVSAKWPLWAFSFLARRELRRQGLAYLPCYYPGRPAFANTLQLARRLEFASPTEVITHPAQQGDLATLQYNDSYDADRVEEYQALLRIGRYLGSQSGHRVSGPAGDTSP